MGWGDTHWHQRQRAWMCLRDKQCGSQPEPWQRFGVAEPLSLRTDLHLWGRHLAWWLRPQLRCPGAASEDLGSIPSSGS